MIELGDIVIAYIVFMLAWYIWQAQKSREHARTIAADHCRQLGVQLLDDTVVLSRIRIKRNRSGRIKIARYYDFEFSSLGNERYQGGLELQGSDLVQISMDAHRI